MRRGHCIVSLLLAICSIGFLPAFSQVKRQDVDFEKLFDDLFPVQDLDLNYDELYENLAQILINPIDLNEATHQQLQSLYLLNEMQVNEIVDYRNKTGPFLSIYELQSLESIDSQTLEKILPFFTVEDASKTMNRTFWQRLSTEQNNYFILRYERTIETKHGYRADTDSAARYAGSPDKFYARYRVSRTGDFSFGFTIEKDAGEQIAWTPANKIYGFDNYSFHAQVMNQGIFKNIIIGDYQAQFGQGLGLGGGFGMGKGSETITTIRRANLGFIPYTSLNEFGFFRGMAITVEPILNFKINGFGSSISRDGLLQQDSESDQSFFTSLTATGLHRTPRELSARKQIRENNLGLTLNYQFKSLEAGIMVHHTSLNPPLQPNPNTYNQFLFSGTGITNIGSFLNYSYSNYTVFGEFSKSLDAGYGFNAGLLSSLTSSFDFSLFIRHYEPDYQTFYTNAVAENSIPRNESGMYWGLKYKINHSITASGYVDVFKFPWLRYRGYSPSTGSEGLLRLTWQPSKLVSFFIQGRQESKIRNLPDNTTNYKTGMGTKNNFWLNADYSLTKNIHLKTRGQFSNYKLEGNKTNGMTLIQDVNVDAGRFTISARYALFDTDDIDNRQYVYERDVWLAFSFPSYSGVGVRSYLMVQYNVNRNVDLWIRWARTQFSDRETIGSGGELIDGDTRNDIKFQLRFRF
ncbi:MAG: helix-hairpin-helix domain-containing protein [Flammeovirgaceae bacterium]|nr:helix-hairpin-helix domain-containing protein [Flammeovirgaceae bacterium]